MTAVMSAPARMPRRGSWNAVIRLGKVSVFVSGLTASLIRFIPYISNAKPTRIRPIFFGFGFFAVMRKITPTSANAREKFSGLRKLIHTAEPSIPEKQRSHAVTVVPIFAPIITPID